MQSSNKKKKSHCETVVCNKNNHVATETRSMQSLQQGWTLRRVKGMRDTFLLFMTLGQIQLGHTNTCAQLYRSVSLVLTQVTLEGFCEHLPGSQPCSNPESHSLLGNWNPVSLSPWKYYKYRLSVRLHWGRFKPGMYCLGEESVLM